MADKSKGTSESGRKLRNWAGRVCLWVLLAVLGGLPVEARAHALLVRSDPADHASLMKSPKQLQIWFSELLDDGFNIVEVYPAGQVGAPKHINLVEGQAGLDPKDRTCLVVKLKALPPGDYVAEWRVLSRDGHSAPGKISFQIMPAKGQSR